MSVKNIRKSLEIVRTTSSFAAKQVLRIIRDPHIYFAILADIIFILLLVLNLPTNQLDGNIIRTYAVARLCANVACSKPSSSALGPAKNC
jgi:hypothetical protein